MENLELNKSYSHQNLTRHSFLAKSYDRIKNFDKAYYHFKINNVTFQIDLDSPIKNSQGERPGPIVKIPGDTRF